MVKRVLEGTSAEARKVKRMSLYKGLGAVVVGALLIASPVSGASAGPRTASPAVQQVDDSTLESRIEASLKKDATIVASKVDVDVKAGIATLKGVVRNADEKARATRIATINGVTEVRNDLVVDAAAVAKSGTDKAIDATKQAGEKTAEVTKDVAVATKDVAVATAKKTKEVVSTTGEVITDGWITTRVSAKFVDEPLLKDSNINVDTNDHVVTLKGTVMSSAGKTRAEAIAKGNEGVKRVVNQLVVKGT